jgi:hypothetical protein
VADYFTTAVIAKRLGITTSTLWSWYYNRQFLMYKRRRTTKNIWYTNDALIGQWEYAQCTALRQQRIRDRYVPESQEATGT